MSRWAELWAAESAVNPTYHEEQWPKCPECGEPLVFRYRPPLSECINPDPMAVEWRIVYCDACGWARVRSAFDPPEVIGPEEVEPCTWCGEPLALDHPHEGQYAECRACGRLSYLRVVERRPIVVAYRTWRGRRESGEGPADGVE